MPSYNFCILILLGNHCLEGQESLSSSFSITAPLSTQYFRVQRLQWHTHNPPAGWNAKKKITWFSFIYAHTVFPSLIWFFRWIPGFIFEIIRNLGIRPIRVRVFTFDYFKLIVINTNQSKEIELGCYVHICNWYLYIRKYI